MYLDLHTTVKEAFETAKQTIGLSRDRKLFVSISHPRLPANEKKETKIFVSKMNLDGIKFNQIYT